MDVSLFSCDKSETIELNEKSDEPSVQPKKRRAMGCRKVAAHKRTLVVTDGVSTSGPSLKNTLRRIPSKFRWRSSHDVVQNSLKGMSFTISGTLDSLNAEDVVEMIEYCDGTVYKTLAKKTKYLIAGNNASKTWINNAIESQKTILNEKKFLDLVTERGKIQKFSNYREQTNDSDEDDDHQTVDDIVISSDTETIR